MKIGSCALVCPLVISCWSLVGCGWTKKLEFRSPSGKYRLEVYQPRGFIQEANLRADFVDESGRRMTLYEARHEFFLQFAHAYWSPNETTAGLIGCGTSSFQIAYDVSGTRAIPFATVREGFNKSLLDSYPSLKASPGNFDPVTTSCLAGGWVEEFQQRYPHGTTDK